MHWSIGGITNFLSPSKAIYQEENLSITESQINIGLLYISDYRYAEQIESWGKKEINTVENNWINDYQAKWTITYDLNSVYGNFIDNKGKFGHSFLLDEFSVYPVFYLNHNVTFSSGDGSQSNPFLLDEIIQNDRPHSGGAGN